MSQQGQDAAASPTLAGALQDRDLRSKDLVLWHSFGVTHIPRSARHAARWHSLCWRELAADVDVTWCVGLRTGQ